MRRDFLVNAAAALAAVALATAACGTPGWEVRINGTVVQRAQPEMPARDAGQTAQGLVERR